MFRRSQPDFVSLQPTLGLPCGHKGPVPMHGWPWLHWKGQSGAVFERIQAELNGLGRQGFILEHFYCSQPPHYLSDCFVIGFRRSLFDSEIYHINTSPTLRKMKQRCHEWRTEPEGDRTIESTDTMAAGISTDPRISLVSSRVCSILCEVMEEFLSNKVSVSFSVTVQFHGISFCIVSM